MRHLRTEQRHPYLWTGEEEVQNARVSFRVREHQIVTYAEPAVLSLYQDLETPHLYSQQPRS